MVQRKDNIYSCVTKTESCHEYMSRVEPLVQMYKVPTAYIDIGEEKLGHTYVPETHRDHLRTIVNFVCKLHNKGRSLKSLDESNIVFHNNMLRLRGLNFVDSLGVEDRVRDLTLLHNLLESLFGTYNNKKYRLPASVVDLLSTLRECRYIYTFIHTHKFSSTFNYCFPRLLHFLFRSESKGMPAHILEQRLPLHLGLLRHDISIEYIKNFCGDVCFMLSDQEVGSYDEALWEMTRSDFNKEDWTQGFKGAYPEAGPAQDCYQYERPKKCGYVGGQRSSDRVVNRSILRFCRNMATHLHEHIPKVY